MNIFIALLISVFTVAYYKGTGRPVGLTNRLTNLFDDNKNKNNQLNGQLEFPELDCFRNENGADDDEKEEEKKVLTKKEKPMTVRTMMVRMPIEKKPPCRKCVFDNHC